MRLVYYVEPGKRFILAESAINVMTKHRQSSPQNPESGGVLLGRHLLESEDVIVDEVTIPSSSDTQSRFGFFRSKKHNSVAQRRWKESGGRVDYLGLWHTHPENVPVPSSVDLHDWVKASDKDTYGGDRLYFLILGITEIRVWSKSRSGPLQELDLIRRHDAAPQGE